MKFKGIRFSINHVLSIAFLLVFSCLCSNAKADVIYDEDGSGFTLVFDDSSVLGNGYVKGKFQENYPGDYGSYPKSNKIDQLFNSEVLGLFRSRSDVDGGDFGFWDNDFLIISQYTNNLKQIDRIEIGWSYIPIFGGKIRLFGSFAEDSPFTDRQISESALIKMNCDVDVIFSPDKINLSPTIYYFDKPVHYLTLIFLSSNVDIARFSYLKVHFIDAVSDPVVLFPAETDIEWNKRGMTLEASLTSGGKVLDIDRDNLKFYIQPEFDIVEKPNPLNENVPENMLGQAWRLYKIFENSEVNNGLIYDGYLERKDKIACDFNTSNGDFKISIPAPCSGKYSLHAELNDDNGNAMEIEPILLNIWPGIKNSYEEIGRIEYGAEYDGNNPDPIYFFGINWVNFNDNLFESLLYPFDEDGTGFPYAWNSSVIHIPGLYNVEEIYYKWDSEPVPASETGDDLSTYHKQSEYPLDVKHITTQGDNLNIRIAKNGALTPVDNQGSLTRFNVTLSDQKQVPTGVDSVATAHDGGEVEFFNMQGMKVNKPGRGIYIKRIGDRVEKILNMK